jgi:hypothetical protein
MPPSWRVSAAAVFFFAAPGFEDKLEFLAARDEADADTDADDAAAAAADDDDDDKEEARVALFERSAEDGVVDDSRMQSPSKYSAAHAAAKSSEEFASSHSPSNAASLKSRSH